VHYVRRPFRREPDFGVTSVNYDFAELLARGGSAMMKPSRPGSHELATATSPVADERAFAEVVEMIQAARGRALAAVNTELVELYWRVGEYISRKLETATWGEGVVEELAHYIQRRQPNIRGFTRRSLFRMRQFFDAYRGHEKVSALLTQLPWTHHLLILSGSKRPEEREFYIRLAVQERWSSRELERQLAGALFERAVMSPPKVSAALRQFTRMPKRLSATPTSSSSSICPVATARQTSTAASSRTCAISSLSLAATSASWAARSCCRSAARISLSTSSSTIEASPASSPSS
jgi:predicted nuclease of restriction endonuclease-like (RecB) superfamily